MTVYAPTKVVKRWFDGYRAAAAELEYEPDPEKMVLAIPAFLAETDEKALEEARGPIEWLFHKGLKMNIEIILPPGYMSPGSLRGMLESGMKPFSETSYEELLDGGYVLVGSPSTVAEKIEQLRQELGFGAMCILMSIGNISKEKTLRTMELFASEVMPQFPRFQAPEPVLA
jgi:alkanesulfonate monooxygenase SsuD/methylene tetrahydromethanopterin reductase-like flavin-dependent oxidoreductase (luciferase family)